MGGLWRPGGEAVPIALLADLPVVQLRPQSILPVGLPPAGGRLSGFVPAAIKRIARFIRRRSSAARRRLGLPLASFPPCAGLREIQVSEDERQRDGLSEAIPGQHAASEPSGLVCPSSP